MPSPPPPPFHILRAHAAPLSCLHFTAGNTHLLAGDQDGVVSVSALRARRVLASWAAHEGGVLGVGEWAGGVVSQGRDNTVKFYDHLDAKPTGGATTAPPPRLRREIPSNALNFCRFSLAYLPGEGPGSGVPVAEGGKDLSDQIKAGAEVLPTQALLALPNLTDSELLDIYAVPSLDRIGAAVNFRPAAASETGAATVDARSGLVMGLHVAVVQRDGEDTLALVAGYEDGRVELWTAALARLLSREREWDGRRETDKLWSCVWSAKAHNEAVMALAVDADFTRAFTASADHILARVDLGMALAGDDGALRTYPTTYIGNSALAVSSDGRVLAVGGWDGKIRLYSAATFKPLGTLAYHRESVQALAFASRSPPLAQASSAIGEGESDSDDAGEADAGDPSSWLASGGKDRRVALWSLRFGQR